MARVSAGWRNADRTLHDVYQECQAAGQIGIAADDVLRYLRDAGEALDYMFEKHNLQHLDGLWKVLYPLHQGRHLDLDP